MAGRKSIPPKALTFAQTPGVTDPALQRALDVVTRSIQDLQGRRHFEEFTSIEPGYVPASGGSAIEFLAADGTWKSIVGSGAVDSVSAGSTKVTVAPTTGAVIVDVVPANFTGIPESGVSGLVADLAARPTGSGTLNKVPKWASASALVDSSITDTGALVTVASPMTVTGAGTFNTTLDVTGNFAVATSKFTVAAATGNTVIAGTLTLSPMTQGSVLFIGASSVVTQDNSNIYYDATNKRFGVGSGIAGAPTNPITTKGAGTSDMISMQNTTTSQWATIVARDDGGTVRTAWGYGNASSTDTPRAARAHWWAENGTDFVIMRGGAIPGTQLVFIGNTTGNMRIGSTVTDPGVKLQVDGTTSLVGNSTVTGTLGVSSDFAVNTSKFTVAATSGNTAVAGTLNATGLATLTGGFTLGADSSANSHKITSLTNGSSAQDAAAFGQLATAVNAAVSGTSGKSARFSGTNTVGNGAFTDDTTNASISGTLTVTGANYLSLNNTGSAGTRKFAYINTSGTNYAVIYESGGGALRFGGSASIGGAAAVESLEINPNAAAVTVLGTLSVDGAATLHGGVAIGDAGGDAHAITGTLTANGTAGSNGNVLTLVAGLPQWAAPSGGGGGSLSDADYGDITVSGSATVMTIDNDVVTYAKMQNVSATSRIMGRITAGSGDMEELTGTQATTLLDAFTSGLKGLTPASGGGTSNFLRADGSWAVPTTATLGDADYGDITVSGTGTVLTIDNNVVTYAKMQDVTATSRFIGRITAGSGDPEELTGTQATSLLDTFATAATTKGVVPGSNSGGATVYLNGNAAWTTPPGFTYSDLRLSPSADPASANSLDDEFNSGSTLGGAWTVFDSTGTSNSVANSAVTLTKTAVAHVAGYTQSFSPGSAAWTFECRINMSNVGKSGTAFPTCGMVVTDGTKYILGGYFNNNGTQQIGIHYWTNTTTFNSDLATGNVTLPAYTVVVTGGWAYQPDLWLRLQRSSNNVILSWSANGYDWITLTATNGINNLGTISGIGIGVQNNNAVSISPRYLYFRKIA